MFWVRYLTVLALGTAAVWFLSPAAFGMLRQRFAEFAATESAVAESTDGGMVATPDDDGDNIPSGLASTEEDDDNGAGFFASVQSGSGNETAIQDNSGDIGETQEARRPLSLERIWQSSNDVVLWGVVTRSSQAYRKDGKKLPANAPGGTLVEITKTTFTNKGEEMALCVLWDEVRRRWTGPLLVSTANLATFHGTRDGFLDEDVGRLMEFCRLKAALAARREKLDRAAVDRNPHAAPLRQIDADTKKLAARTKELTALRDRLTGADRNRIADELREMEAVATEMSIAAKREMALYEEWKKAHPSEKIDYMKDPEYWELKMKLRAASPGVAMFGLSGGAGGDDVE